MRLSNCRYLARQPLTGTWFRALRPQFYQTPLAYAHSIQTPTRFNPGSAIRPGFPVLYFAESPLVCLYEVEAIFGTPYTTPVPITNPTFSWTTIGVTVQLRSMADLTTDSQIQLIQSSIQELTGDWVGYRHRSHQPTPTAPYWTNVPTQKLGYKLYSLRGLEGFLTYSARFSVCRNLVVFPDKLRKGSYIRYTDPAAGTVLQIP